MPPTEQDQSWLLSTLRRIRKRPGMYLRDDRLNSLACYIDGIIHGREDVGAAEIDTKSFLDAFGKWLGDRLRRKNGDCWFYLTTCMSERTGHVDAFYRELDMYLTESGFKKGLNDEKLTLDHWRLRTS